MAFTIAMNTFGNQNNNTRAESTPNSLYPKIVKIFQSFFNCLFIAGRCACFSLFAYYLTTSSIYICTNYPITSLIGIIVLSLLRKTSFFVTRPQTPSVAPVAFATAPPETVEDRLFRAVNEENVQEVRRLLPTPGINVNRVNFHGYSLLIRAAYKGNREIFQAILETPGVNVNFQANQDTAFKVALREAWGYPNRYRTQEERENRHAIFMLAFQHPEMDWNQTTTRGVSILYDFLNYSWPTLETKINLLGSLVRNGKVLQPALDNFFRSIQNDLMLIAMGTHTRPPTLINVVDRERLRRAFVNHEDITPIISEIVNQIKSHFVGVILVNINDRTRELPAQLDDDIGCLISNYESGFNTCIQRNKGTTSTINVSI